MTATPTTSITFQNFYSATLTADITDTATDIFLDTVPNGSEGFIVIEPDSSTNREVVYYNSKTATKVVCPSAADGRGQDDTTAHSHLTGATVIMAPLAAYFETLLSLFTTTPQGWTSLSGTFTSPTYNGNRSYTMTTSVDQTSVLSKGHRLKLTRTVTAPTKCTDLESGSTQYYSKSSPAGMTFTDDFTASAWVKLESYGAISTIASRYNGTSGWTFTIESDGCIQLCGFNASASNFSKVKSNQAIPLGRWIHVAAQLDMSTFTATTTTSYTMVNGLDTPAAVSRGGTNPTALIQAGNLEIGGSNSGANPFDGKLAQVAVYSAKVTQANMKLTIGQTLSGSESNLISAYSFNNTINDLNTGNANNLTAQNSAVATNADSPFAQGVDAVSGVTAGTVEYGIVTALDASTVTFQVPEGSAIPTSGGLSAVSYSTYKVPYGFPASHDKWSIIVLCNNDCNKSSPANGTWYGDTGLSSTGPNISVPIGAWRATYLATGRSTRSSTTVDLYITLSTGSSTESDSTLTTVYYNGAGGATSVDDRIMLTLPSGDINVTSATTYYMNIKATQTSSNIGLYGSTTQGIIIKIVSAYL